MTTSDFDNHKVDHLFLLIGENPLPNYVAARLLLKDHGTVHLVYTTQTKKRADLLKAELTKLNITVKPVELGDFSADGYKIRNKIKEKVKPLKGRIGLNYTGGTKAMAVHAYQIFVELELDDPVFSYLDSIKLQMFIEDINNKNTRPIPSALAICPEPKLEQILGLHNLSWKENKEPVSNSQLPAAAIKFAALYRDSNNHAIIQSWKNWCQVVVDRGKDKKNGGYRTDENLNTKLQIIELTSANKEVKIPDEVQNIFREALDINFQNEIDIQIIKDKYCLKISEFYEWLDNGWLEDYVMSQLEKIAQELNIHEINRSLHIKDPIKDPENERDKDQFEFDVAFLRGYQLFGISCTTIATHKDLKQKLFEAHLRAKQLGGDEARVALVSRCTKKDCEDLKKELSFVVEDRKIEVFGIDDLEPINFAKKLKSWINRNI